MMSVANVPLGGGSELPRKSYFGLQWEKIVRLEGLTIDEILSDTEEIEVKNKIPAERIISNKFTSFSHMAFPQHDDYVSCLDGAA